MFGDIRRMAGWSGIAPTWVWAAAAVALGWGHSGRADDLISNTGFEAGLDGWTVAHAGRDDPDASYKAVAEMPHTGKFCVKYEKPRGPSRNSHLDQIINVKPQTSYALSAWVKSDGRLTPLLSVEAMDWRPIAEARRKRSTEWHKVSLPFNSGKRSQVRLVWYGGSRGRRYQGYPGKSWLDEVEVRPATAEEIRALEARTRTDTTGWFEFPIKWDDVAPAPALGAEKLLDPPAGKHGFVQAKDGHLYFADGRRAKFWGVCMCGREVMPTHEQAEKIAVHLAKMGMNIARVHALECAIFDPRFDDTQHLSAEMLERMDYFIAQLKKRGIYTFFDWHTYWRPRKGDGVAPRQLYHWTMLDERFVELHKSYARVLFLHKNPYTGNRYVDEPAVAAFEIINEKDLFSPFHDNKLRNAPDMLRLKEALKTRWNRWLTGRYGNAAGLRRVWTNSAGECGLGAGEDPLKGTVEIPLPATELGSWDRDYKGTKGTARASDALLFCYEVQTDCFLKLREFLRAIGVRAPISGTNWYMNVRPNVRSNAQMDFTESHAYWTHARPWPPSRAKSAATNNVAMLSCSPTTTDTLIYRLGRGKVPGKPFMVTEWNFDSPNEYRCEGPIEMAAYGALQDWDGIICYGYYCGWGRSWDEAAKFEPLGMFIGSEQIYNDPSLICQFPVAAAIFLRGDVRAAKHVVDIGYSKTDTFYAQGKWGEEMAHFGFLPFLHRVRHAYFDEAYTGDADVVVSSGLSASGSYAQTRRSILFCDNPSADLYNKSMGRHQLVAKLYPQLRFGNRPAAELSFEDRLWPWRNLEVPLQPGIELRTLPQGAKAFGTAAHGQLCLGFIDDKRCIAPGASALREIDEAWFYHLFTGAMEHWSLTPRLNAAKDPPARAAQPTLVSDTDELSWNSLDGVFTLNTPCTQGAVGFLAGKKIKLAEVEIAAKTKYCSIMLTSADGQPIRTSTRLLLTAVARSENTGQSWASDRMTIPVEGRGRAPVLVEPVEAEVTITSNLVDAEVLVRPLDPTGTSKAMLRARRGNRGITIRVGKRHATVFYAIELGPHR